VSTLVLGLGNELVGDDAVGVLTARAVRVELDCEGFGGTAHVVESSASGLALIEILAGYDRAVIVDAIMTGKSPPGTITEMGMDEVGRVVAPSVHQAGLPELAAVAERLGLGFPSRTVVLAVEVVDPYTFGAGLSEPVAGALEELVRRVCERVRRWEHGAGCTTTTPSRPSSNG
jgi:hydrogenase maturation protease